MEGKTRRPGPRRLRTVHPAPAAAGWKGEAGALEAVGGELGLVLWKALRRVRLWAESEPERRAGLFPAVTAEIRGLTAAAGAQAPELLEALGVFTALLRAPAEADGKQLARACNQVYEWADAQGLSRVAMHFAEAAAAADPSCPGWAIDSGWMCRRVAVDDLMERSAAWYERAYGLAIRTQNRQEVIRSLTEYGALLKDLGRYEKARSCYLRAAQRAARTGRLRHAAVAEHYLLGLVAETGAYLEAERYARLALEHYPIHDPRIPYLAHDFAFLLLRHSYYSLALPLLERLVQTMPRRDELLLVYSSIAWAAGGAGERERFTQAEQRISQIIDPTTEFAPAALIHAAEGSRLLSEWEKAEHYARQAGEAAKSRKNIVVEKEAGVLLKNISDRIPAPVELSPAYRDRIEHLNHRFAIRLNKWAAPGYRSPGAGSDSRSVTAVASNQ